MTSFTLILRRCFASKGGQGDRTAPVKQVFMKKRKEDSSSAMNGIGMNRIAPLTNALFNVDPANVEAAKVAVSDPHEQQKRRVIELAWNRTKAQQQEEQTAWEKAFMRSKCAALDELKALSPKLYAQAVKYDYSLPPIHQRPATLTAPHPDQFPYKQVFRD